MFEVKSEDHMQLIINSAMSIINPLLHGYSF